jgi:hypothetical protein
MGGIVGVPWKVSVGTYAGDSTPNKAVAHGLGREPIFMIIGSSVIADNSYSFMVLKGGFRGYTVTDWNTVNFYIGNSADYTTTMNLTGKNYSFIAVG